MTATENTRSDTLPAIEWRLERRPHGRLDFVDAQGRVHADVDVLRLPDSGAVITDTYGVRYTIPSVARLDSHSRRLFEKAL